MAFSKRRSVIYDSYSFIDKDPIVDKVRTVVQDAKVSYRYLEGVSRVGVTTIRGMFEGKTRRPQHATVNAILRALGKELVVADINRQIIDVAADFQSFQDNRMQWRKIRDAKLAKIKKTRRK